MILFQGGDFGRSLGARSGVSIGRVSVPIKRGAKETSTSSPMRGRNGKEPERSLIRWSGFPTSRTVRNTLDIYKLPCLQCFVTDTKTHSHGYVGKSPKADRLTWHTQNPHIRPAVRLFSWADTWDCFSILPSAFQRLSQL